MSESVFTSFIIPARNSSGTVESCIRSIFSQDYPADRIEVIVVDNCSTDDTREIATRCGARVIANETRRTIATLRNQGVRVARGEYLAFIDSDMILPKTWLADASGILREAIVGMTGAKSHFFPDDAPWVQKVWNLHLDRDKDKRDVTWINSRAIIVKRPAFDAAGGFDDSLEVCEDAEFGYRLNKKYTIVSDRRLMAMHLKEARTLGEMFRKEAWRGKDSLRVSMMRLQRGDWKELFDIGYLLYFLVLLVLLAPATAVAVMGKGVLPLAAIALGLVAPVAFLSFDTCRRAGRFDAYGQLFLIYGTYVLARVWGIFRWEK